MRQKVCITKWNYIGEDEYYDTNKPKIWNLNGAKMVQVDGSEIKADTWYTMRNGEVVEMEEDD